MEEIITRLTNLSAWIVPIIILAGIVLPQAIRILREYERGVIFRLGKLLGAKGRASSCSFPSWTAWSRWTCASSRLMSRSRRS